MSEHINHGADNWVEPMKIESTSTGVKILSECDECGEKIWEIYDKVREINESNK